MEDLVFTLYFMMAAALALVMIEGLRRIWRRLARRILEKQNAIET